ncbi:MAG: molybdopterin molybdenumtransferase MoeA, partial [Planctomycetota bacterium]|nr:molybdopterin molybdenumtransferase MoeA [Planctomycetota bacterium]
FFPRIIIRKLSGLDPQWPYQKSVLPLARKITSTIGRTDYARVRVSNQGVEPIAISGASILSSTSQAEGFCIIPQDSEGYPEGTQIEVFLYD